MMSCGGDAGILTVVQNHNVGSTQGWRTAYLVLTHTDAAAVVRLVAAIRRSSPRCVVIVAHDARVQPPPAFADEHVLVWCHGLATDWGSWELVEATLGAVAQARAFADPDFFVLVSGQDYPARHLGTWEDEVRAAGGGWIGRPRPLRYRPTWGRRPGVGDDDLTRYSFRWWPLPPAVARMGRPGGRYAAASPFRAVHHPGRVGDPVGAARGGTADGPPPGEFRALASVARSSRRPHLGRPSGAPGLALAVLPEGVVGSLSRSARGVGRPRDRSRRQMRDCEACLKAKP